MACLSLVITCYKGKRFGKIAIATFSVKEKEKGLGLCNITTPLSF